MATNTTSGSLKGSILFRNGLLICGIISSCLYVAMNIFVPTLWEGYSSSSQTVSELSAIDAPTRSVWVPLGFAYTLLVTAFGWGVMKSAPKNTTLFIVGRLIIVYGVVSIFWPFAPMHLREVLAAGGSTRSDTMHIIFAMVTVLLMLLAMGFGASAFGKHFRIYSITSIAILLVCGAFTSIDATKIDANLPTPWIGVWERINIGVFLVWVVVLALVLLRSEPTGNKWTLKPEHCFPDFYIFKIK